VFCRNISELGHGNGNLRQYGFHAPMLMEIVSVFKGWMTRLSTVSFERQKALSDVRISSEAFVFPLVVL